MRIALLWGWLLAVGMLLAPVYSKAADNGNWDDDWAYFQQSDEANTTSSDAHPAAADVVCPVGLNHYGSPCFCALTSPGKTEDLGEPIVCHNPFGDDEDFLSDFQDFLGKSHDFSLDLPVFRLLSTCPCPNECGGTVHCSKCGEHEKQHGEAACEAHLTCETGPHEPAICKKPGHWKCDGNQHSDLFCVKCNNCSQYYYNQVVGHMCGTCNGCVNKRVFLIFAGLERGILGEVLTTGSGDCGLRSTAA